jgi:hypothetical protein
MSLALTTGHRTLATDGSKYDHLFDNPKRDDLIIIQDGSVEQTVQEMVKLVNKYYLQTAKLAQLLRGRTTEESTKNIWNFIYDHVQYREDKAGVEQLRTPSRTWADRKNGVDCDCMSIFAASLLKNMSIPYQFKIVKYGGKDFQHVYVVVPTNSLSGRYIVIDGVLDQYNYELDYSQQKTFNGMNGIPIQVLNGIGNTDECEEKLHQFILQQRSAVMRNPEQCTALHWENAIRLVDYVDNNWADPQDRITAFQQVAKAEAQYHPQSKLFRSIVMWYEGNATCDQVLATAWIKGSALSGLGMKGKNVWAEVALAGPRQAYLGLVKLNMFHWADKMCPGFFGGLNDQVPGRAQWEQYRQSYASAFGMTVTQQRSTRDKVQKILDKWHDTLGGDWSTLKNAVMVGSQKMRKRVENLPGYRYWYNWDDWGGKPTGSGTAQNPVGIGGILPHEVSPDLSGASLGDAGATAAIITAAAAIIASLAGLVSTLQKPGNADPSISDAGDPMLDAAQLAALEAEAAKQNAGNPDNSGWKTVGIIAGVLALVTAGFVMLNPSKLKK